MHVPRFAAGPQPTPTVLEVAAPMILTPCTVTVTLSRIAVFCVVSSGPCSHASFGEGFAFSGQLGALTGADGIFAEWDGADLWGDNLTIQHCTFDAAMDTAIQLEFSWFSHVLDCYFDACDDYGIFVDTAGSGASNLDIRDCTFFNVGTGALTLEDTDLSVVQGNRVYNDNAQAGAAAVDEGITTVGGADNMICDNYFSCLLPGPGNGDWNDLNSGNATDAFIANHCLNGDAITTPT